MRRVLLSSDLHQARTRRGQRSALTLLEVMLALVILAVLAALAAPSLHRVWERQRLRAAGDQLRAAFTRAHVRAMRDGQTLVLRCELGGDRYAVQPWLAGDETINASAREAFNLTQPQAQFKPIKEERLPEDVQFLSAFARFDTRAMEIEQEALNQVSVGTQWSQPILFYPDGTASQAIVTLVNSRGEAVRVTLRKLTGLSTVSDLLSPEDLRSEVQP